MACNRRGRQRWQTDKHGLHIIRQRRDMVVGRRFASTAGIHQSVLKSAGFCLQLNDGRDKSHTHGMGTDAFTPSAVLVDNSWRKFRHKSNNSRYKLEMPIHIYVRRSQRKRSADEQYMERRNQQVVVQACRLERLPYN